MFLCKETVRVTTTSSSIVFTIKTRNQNHVAKFNRKQLRNQRKIHENWLPSWSLQDYTPGALPSKGFLFTIFLGIQLQGIRQLFIRNNSYNPDVIMIQPKLTKPTQKFRQYITQQQTMLSKTYAKIHYGK